MSALPPLPRPRRWVWFFLALVVLGVTAVVVPIVYNLSIQLRPEQLAEARRLWRENAPADYDLEYLVKTTKADGEEETPYRVEVRGGRAVFVAANGEVLGVDAALAAIAGPVLPALSPEEAGRYAVPALFDQIEATLHQDETAGGRHFATARFDPKDGHPYHYVHRVRGTRERVEWNVKLTRIAPSGRDH
jgi:hypothetical protein